MQETLAAHIYNQAIEDALKQYRNGRGAIAALNEMLEEAWDEGYEIGVTDGGNEHGYCVDHNPYRKATT